MPVDLSIEVREDATLQQGILSEVDAPYNVARLELRSGVSMANLTTRDMAVTHHNLLRLGKVVDGVHVQLHDSDLAQRRKLLGDDLGGVEHVEAELQSLLLVDGLHIELPLGKVARLDGVPKILAMEVGILSCNVLRLVPDQAGLALLRLPVPLDELGFALVVDEAKGMNTEAVLAKKLVSYRRGLPPCTAPRDIPCA